MKSNHFQVRAWISYDIGNSAFSTTVVAGFFPIFFKQYWSQGIDVETSTLLLGLANGFASACIALASPFLGAIADRSSSKRKFLILFTLLGVLATFVLGFLSQGSWKQAVLLYMVANLGFAGGVLFNDAYLVDIVEKSKMHITSIQGYAAGYLGGGFLLVVNVLMYQKPEVFGMSSSIIGIQASFMTVAVWWLMFTLPSIFAFKDKKEDLDVSAHSVTRSLMMTAKDIYKSYDLKLFLMAYWIYIDGIGTVIKMAVDYGMAIGFAASDLVGALILTQFVGFPAAILFGKLGDRFGAKQAIIFGLCVYTGISFYSYTVKSHLDFYVIAALIGCVQGGVQALSRSLFALFVPKEKSAEYFGFFNLTGRFAAVLGPVVIGVVSATTHSPRLSILSISVFFILGIMLLWNVKVPSMEDARS
ncbi:MAG: MFS transporter [Oligoflexales bacterium]